MSSRPRSSRPRRWDRAACVVTVTTALGVGGIVGLAPTTSTALGAVAPRCSLPVPASAVAHSDELVTVQASRLGASNASLVLYRRLGGCLRRIAGPYPAEVGAKGLSLHHVEGDETTPVGLFAFGSVMYGALPSPGLAYPYRRLVCGDWWDEDPRSASYNRFVALPCGTTPTFGAGSEALWRTVPAYDYFAVIGYNAAPVVKARGSAIFLHVDTGTATVGCVSLPASELLMVLRALAPSLHPLIAIGTSATFPALRAPENL